MQVVVLGEIPAGADVEGGRWKVEEKVHLGAGRARSSTQASSQSGGRLLRLSSCEEVPSSGGKVVVGLRLLRRRR